MARLSALPLVFPLHRLAVSMIGAMEDRDRLFDLYCRAWRKVGCDQVARTQFQTKMLCDLRDKIPATIFHFGLWEPDISHMIAGLLSEGDVFVDVGANIGYYSLMASRLVGDAGAVVAVEASPRIFSRLEANIRANQAANIRAVNVAAADQSGRVTIYSGPRQNSGASSTLKEWRNGEAEAVVAALPLDQILTEDERGRVRLVKIDVEGAETPILSQLLSSIDSYPHDMGIIVEFSPDSEGAAWRAIFSGFLARGFKAYGINNEYDESWYLKWRRPGEIESLEDCPTGKLDVLFTRHAPPRMEPSPGEKRGTH
jgi:FkbM family methyltransferase